MKFAMNSSAKSWVKNVKQKTVYHGFHQVKHLILQHRLFKEGWIPPIQREVMMRGDAVAVLLFDPRLMQFVFNEQFRAGVFLATQTASAVKVNTSPWLLEIAAGAVEPDESLTAVAKREVKEETGLIVEALLPICSYWTSPANNAEKVSLFCGRIDASSPVGSFHGVLEEGEEIQTHVVDLDTAYDWLEQGVIQHPPALIALQWFKLHEKWVREQWSV